MADATTISYLQVHLHEQGERRLVGHLSRYGETLRMSFADAYIEDAHRPTLSLSLRGADDQATRDILRARRDERLVGTHGRLPPYFANLLPEGHNRIRLAAERGCEPEDEFELLVAAGLDLMGAVEVTPMAAHESVPRAVSDWHVALGLDVVEPGFVEMPVEDATGLAGVVPKFSAIKDGHRYVIRRHGQAGAFILKLPTTRHPDLVDNEAMGYRLLESLGLRCAKAAVIRTDEADLPEAARAFPTLLSVERFDRGPDGRRIHMEEFAQALSYRPSHKYGRSLSSDYGRMLGVLDALSDAPVQEVREFVARFIAFILMGNTDAHLKNWALLYPDGRTPTLAPAYDPVCVTAYFDESPPQDYGVNRRIDETLRAYGWDDLEALLKSARLRRIDAHMRVAREVVSQARASWPDVLGNGPANVVREITARLNGGVALTR